MAWTQAQLDAIDEAIAGGVLEVWYADKKIKYRSLEEMLKVRALMVAELNPSKTFVKYASPRSGHFPTT